MSTQIEGLSKLGSSLNRLDRQSINSRLAIYSKGGDLFRIHPDLTHDEPVISPSDAGLEPNDERNLGKIANILGSRAVERTVGGGLYTFGAIRPLGNLFPGREDAIQADQDLANTILDRVRTRFDIVLGLTIPPNRPTFEEFYGSLKGKLEGIDMVYQGHKMTVWEQLIQLMASGASTAMVLRAKNLETGTAYKQWRDMIGNTFPSKANPGEIRGDFGVDGVNNIVHGSDSIEAVGQEFKWLSRTIRQWVAD